MKSNPATDKRASRPLFSRIVLLPCWAVIVAALAGCASTPPAPSQVDLDRLVNDYFALRPTEAIGTNLTMDQALASQRHFVSRLESRLGTPVGYKVGLVTQASQQRFGLDSPVRGVLLSGMLLTNRARVPIGFGVSPLCEADMMVVVKDKGINRARTVLEVTEHLSELVCFIELPDNFIATNAPVNGAMLVAGNVGARLGVAGMRIPIRATPEFAQSLADMKITVTDQDGTVLGQAQGRSILDHPLHAVLWLSEELGRAGQSIEAGDVISLGGVYVFTPQAGQTISLTYEDLPGGPIVTQVTFE